MMNFLKDWIIQYQNKYSVGGVETTIERVTGTVSQAGDTISAAYLNEIQKNCIYQVNATRVVEGVLEIFDITIDGSEEFTPFNHTFLIDFSATNTQVDSLLRFNGNTYSLRFSDSISNGDIAPKIGFIPKRALIKLDVTNSKAIIFDLHPNNFISPAFTGTPTTPNVASGDSSTKVANTSFVTGQDLGVGQTWQNMTSSRALDTNYTNTTGKPIEIKAKATNISTGSFGLNIQTDGHIISHSIADGSAAAGFTTTVSAIIPPGKNYKVVKPVVSSITLLWHELR